MTDNTEKTTERKKLGGRINGRRTVKDRHLTGDKKMSP